MSGYPLLKSSDPTEIILIKMLCCFCLVVLISTLLLVFSIKNMLWICIYGNSLGTLSGWIFISVFGCLSGTFIHLILSNHNIFLIYHLDTTILIHPTNVFSHDLPTAYPWLPSISSHSYTNWWFALILSSIWISTSHS